jgi:hypothetical protein
MTRPDATYDPVTAVDEATATGETAAIFADIREVMGIPLITSIWRGLAEVDESLPKAWSIAKPLYQTGQPEAGLARIVARADLPVPVPLTTCQLVCVGLDARELVKARAVIGVYNRSNGMNLVALAAMIAPSRSDVPLEDVTPTFPSWPSLPRLHSMEEIDPAVWDMVRCVNGLGARGPDAFVATLWRHLAHWPGLLALTQAAFAPLQAAGEINAAAVRMVDLAAKEGARMGGLNDGIDSLSDRARDTITNYVTKPSHVARMVTVGHAVAGWLDSAAD